jgi:hypothetical protein
VRGAFLTVLAADLVLIAVGVLTYRPFLSQPGSLGYLAAPVASLLVYVVLTIAATRSTDPAYRRVLLIATIVGSCLGLLEVGNIRSRRSRGSQAR